MRILRPLLPLLVLLAVLVLILASGAWRDFSWHGLARHQAELSDWVGGHPLIAPLAYIGFYTAVAALCLPEAAVVTVAGGLLFGTLFGGALAVVGATLGSIVLFLAARNALAGSFVRRGGKMLARTRAALQRDGFAYLLAVRLVPVFPFWLVNLAAAVGGMRLLPYATATFIGIIPATLVFASLGEGLGTVLAQGRRPNVMVAFSPPVLLPLLALAALSLLPVAWKHWKARRG